LLHRREANPGHYDAVLDLYREAGLEPEVRLRPLIFDLAQTPVTSGAAVAVAGVSATTSLPAALTWRPLVPAAAFDIALVVPALGRSPALERFVTAARDAAQALGWLAHW
jgi:hypothetical protein